MSLWGHLALEGGKKKGYKENQSQLLFPGASPHGGEYSRVVEWKHHSNRAIALD